jgi:hypothetical protein
LHRCIDSVLVNGNVRGARLASLIGPTLQPPHGSHATIETTLDDFCRNATSRMIPVVSLLKAAPPSS